MDNLQRLAEIFSRLEQRNLSIEAGGCTRLRSPKSGCRRCEEACPQGVIAAAVPPPVPTAYSG